MPRKSKVKNKVEKTENVSVKPEKPTKESLVTDKFLVLKNNVGSKTVVTYMVNGVIRSCTLMPHEKSTEKFKDTVEFRNSIKHLVSASVIKLEEK